MKFGLSPVEKHPLTRAQCPKKSDEPFCATARPAKKTASPDLKEQHP